MQYQVIGKNENDEPIVLWRYDDLKLATEKFDFVVRITKQKAVTILLNYPQWKSVELQQVETISLVHFEEKLP
jgi:hypothetical protein